MGKNKGLFLDVRDEEADLIRDLADMRGLTIKAMILSMVKDSIESIGKAIPRPTIDVTVVNPLVADAIRSSYGFFGDFGLDRCGHQLAIRGVTPNTITLSKADRSAIFEAYDGHAKYWGHDAEAIYEHFHDFMVQVTGSEPEKADLGTFVKAFYEFREDKKRPSKASESFSMESEEKEKTSEPSTVPEVHETREKTVESNPSQFEEAIVERISKGTLEFDLTTPLHGIPIHVSAKALPGIEHMSMEPREHRSSRSKEKQPRSQG